MPNHQGYQPLQDEENIPTSPTSNLRFSISNSPEYIHKQSDSKLPEFDTPLGNFNASTYSSTSGPIIRRHKVSRLFYCIAAMICAAILCSTIVITVGLGLHYRCTNPPFTTTKSFSAPLTSIEVLNVLAHNAVLEFEGASDDDAKDIVFVVNVGAPSKGELDQLHINFTSISTTHTLSITGNEDMDMEEFQSHCLATSIRVIVPPRHFFNGTLNVNITNGKITVEEISGWLFGNFYMSNGNMELEDITGAVSTRVALDSGSLELERFQSDEINLEVGSASTELERVDTYQLDVQLREDAPFKMKSPLFRSPDSTMNLRAMKGGKNTIKLSGIQQGNISIDAPQSKGSVGVSSDFCATFECVADEFELSGNGIQLDASSTGKKKSGVLGSCSPQRSSLNTITRGKFKLVVNS
ncbi:hypothetical protein PROFUN_01615 [Planoprotostelium fungivorum]|uniref:Adhesin domain-containing protein n=1 Tax=Planoprotostelium fungivorum TaxID=1890364 RepID=A0A2P6NTQ0_9EUKA|nr:hypothetical protein PROFUN_01615 [Planoprotostelium fungivorum]